MQIFTYGGIGWQLMSKFFEDDGIQLFQFPTRVESRASGSPVERRVKLTRTVPAVSRCERSSAAAVSAVASTCEYAATTRTGVKRVLLSAAAAEYCC